MKMTKAERLYQQAQKKAAGAQKPSVTPPTAAPPTSATAAPRPLAPVPVVEWHGCYDESWKGLISDGSFAHPAKAGRALLHKIFDHLFEIGALSKGGTVVDPFAGIFTTGIIGAWRGVKVIGCELEPRFVELAKENIAIHVHGLTEMQLPIPVIVQGDSRQLRQHVREATAIVSSPPRIDAVLASPPYVSGGHHPDQTGAWNTNMDTPGQKIRKDLAGYGREEGQMGQMKEGQLDAIVSSPPYTEEVVHGRPSKMTEGIFEGRTARTGLGAYGDAPEQLGTMPAGSVDAVISSPPYTGEVGVLNFTGKKPASEQSYSSKVISPDVGYGKTDGQLGGMATGDVDAIVASPPYAELGHGVKSGKVDESKWTTGTPGRKMGASHHPDGYGNTDGQLGDLREGAGVDAIVSSPPYVAPPGHDTGHPRLDKIEDARREAEGCARRSGYGDADGNLAHLKSGTVDAIISSPPYAEIATGAGGLNTQPPKHDGQQGGRSAAAPSQDTDNRYGNAEGQLAKMPKGEVDAIIASPPYADRINNLSERSTVKTDEQREKYHLGGGQLANPQNYGESEGQLGGMKDDGVDVVISSPPYADQPMNPGDTSRPEVKIARLMAEGNLHDAERVRQHCSGAASNLRQQDYGETDGQLGSMKAGEIDAVISSPPYAETIVDRPGEPSAMMQALRANRTDTLEGYGESAGQLGAMKEAAGVDAIVSSPPFGSGDSASAQSITTRTDKSAEWIKANCGAAATQGYGESAGQMAEMPMKEGVDAVVTSPPYEASVVGHDAEYEHQRLKEKLAKGELTGRESIRKALQGINAHSNEVMADYGETPGQVGAMQSDTFWSAALQIVRECHAILRPGGHAVWIVKAFVRDKTIVDFPGDWRKLCEHVGFETVTEIHAMLVKHQEYTNLFGEETVEKKERKSFFRRLYERKHPGNEINYEVVLVMRKNA